MVSTLTPPPLAPPIPMAPQSHSGSLENGGADILLMTSNTRSGGVGQGRASFARRAAGEAP
jgi:hypothetical protein